MLLVVPLGHKWEKALLGFLLLPTKRPKAGSKYEGWFGALPASNSRCKHYLEGGKKILNYAQLV